MADKSSSSDAPRKMRFMPKIPTKKEPRMFTPKLEPVDDTSGDVIDAKLLNLAKQKTEYGGARARFERKTLGAQVAFGHVDAKSSSRYSNIYRATKKDQDGDTNMEEKEYQDPWNYDSYYPVVLPLRLPYSGDPEVLNEEEFGKGWVEYDETKLNAAEDLGLMDDYSGAGNQMMFFQFPSVLPLAKRSATATKSGVDSKRCVPPSEKCSRLEDLPGGYMGKLLVYKSGAVKMKLGDLLYDVTPGMNCAFAQDVMAINVKEKHCCLLGELSKRAVVTPDLDSMLDTEGIPT